MSEIENTLRVSEFVRLATQDIEKIDIIPIAYTIRNRMLSGENIQQAMTACDLSKMGDNSFIGNTIASEPCLESLSIVAGVFSGLYEDPTRGATRFHRHDECPQWSKSLKASALLGPYVYYRA